MKKCASPNCIYVSQPYLRFENSSLFYPISLDLYPIIVIIKKDRMFDESEFMLLVPHRDAVPRKTHYMSISIIGVGGKLVGHSKSLLCWETIIMYILYVHLNAFQHAMNQLLPPQCPLPTIPILQTLSFSPFIDFLAFPFLENANYTFLFIELWK